MRKCIYLFSFLLLALVSCNIDNDRRLSASEVDELVMGHNDSIAVIINSYPLTNIHVPPLYEERAMDPDLFNKETTNKFSELAKGTDGELKLLVNSKLITNEIVHIIKNHAEDNCDLLLLIDKTGSMADDIDNVKKGLEKIITSISKFDNVRLAIALYGDKNVDADKWYSFKNFEKDYTLAKAFINDITVTSGGDYPESVYEGFFESANKKFWKSNNKRMIILIGDAPPLEKPFCKYSLDDVVKKATEDKITMNFYPIVVIPSLGVSDYTEPEVIKFVEQDIITNVYPNPSYGFITVNFDHSSDYKIEVYNSSSILMLTESYSGDEWGKDVSFLENGVYIIRAVDTDNKYDTIKFIVSK